MTVSDAVVTAAERGEEEAVLAWLEGGGRVDATYERGGVSGMTLLMVAMICSCEGLATALLQRGADISLQNSNGITPLMGAASNGHEKVIDALIRLGPLLRHASSVQLPPEPLLGLGSGEDDRVEIIEALLRSLAYVQEPAPSGKVDLVQR